MKIKNTFFLLITILYTGLQAQDSLQVHIYPAKQYPWTVLYELKDVKQSYINNKQQNKDSLFVYNLKGRKPGLYLLMYDMNPNNFVYFIYNNETVSLNVYPFENNRIEVIKSNENKVFLPYRKSFLKITAALHRIEKKLFNKTANHNDAIQYKNLKKQLDSLQQKTQTHAKGLLAEKYIKNMQRFFPDSLLPTETYINLKDKHFFDYLNFNDNDLQRSNIIIDLINDYVFSFNPPQNPQTQHLEYLKKIERILPLINNRNYRNNIIFSLTTSFVNTDGRVSKLLIDKYIKKMTPEEQKQINLQNILDEIGLSIGEQAPDFEFTDLNEKKHTLYQYTAQKPYTLLIFWSATCPHCLHAMPKIKKLMQARPDFTVVAIGLESEKYPWSSEHQYYPEFVHGLKLQKWDNPIVKTYHIKATPTFFVLNNRNEIIAEPYEVKNLEAFLKANPVKPEPINKN